MITLQNKSFNKLQIFKTHLVEDADLSHASFTLVSEVGGRSMELICFVTEGKNYWIVEQDEPQDFSDLDLSNRLEIMENGQLIYSEGVTINEL
ncbi:hypothetical protein ACFST9_04230 [Hymenobacter monticola]|uniref:Uncharacterized protein n=1 Tax=Hymenobacter monticola TaxID=1705399 RepID=A0ABY4B109_9BACT|nr:hypothetical protein [Hymenobacter monticola]UOE32838.1 hypothetical protein MTP16_17090 [Hymenobacter monticola]